ncbi:MAG: cytidine deaminase [Lachnospiraceae bacterium]|jgi:cytidine deaminase|nr:cytidine deaminase [Lachnospiraceae bacterium]GFI01301.1 cytidine deaminase [Lachnospiraceae bacterium]
MVGIEEIPVKELISSAIEARKKAYVPYSGYMVGAAVLTNELRIYTGCNIENASYTPTICAERTAISKAVSEGRRRFLAIAVVGSPNGDVITQYAYPCGVCRQVMREFADPEQFVVIVARSEEDYKLYRLKELLPESFGPENLNV